ncbi:hypothetical protein SETIT_2G013900v2 [Setaria italica]|nr:uncharacterized protein LOC101756288 [Setaria italica]RCV09270.1 hypothetical protein SETIT_2G013900v2 [Setaria italica]RCV09271.1 hypothetical protein SETIT_2G013900v2 [Setaria italica]
MPHRVAALLVLLPLAAASEKAADAPVAGASAEAEAALLERHAAQLARLEELAESLDRFVRARQIPGPGSPAAGRPRRPSGTVVAPRRGWQSPSAGPSGPSGFTSRSNSGSELARRPDTEATRRQAGARERETTKSEIRSRVALEPLAEEPGSGEEDAAWRRSGLHAALHRWARLLSGGAAGDDARPAADLRVLLPCSPAPSPPSGSSRAFHAT